ncbi:MAG: formate dehydrogenase accessory sulfurtransferase FdhD [Desulfarculaceae bacterium]|nr:formate dehydrogenase accessory sulfurtransferase FdhD [Desulfarculaceae bacterium]
MQPMKHPLKTRPILRVRGDAVSPDSITFADERPLSLAVRGRALTVLMATPGLECELAAGYALTMGWAKPGDTPPRVDYHAGQAQVELDLAVDPESLSPIRAAGGGLLGPTEAEPLAEGPGMELGLARGLTEAMGQGQVLYPLTRGTHAAALFDAAGGLLALAEDVGRHNGLDKAVGMAWLEGSLSRAVAVALSGRCSLEMVLKTVRAGVSIIVSVSSPTVPAVEAAERLGLTLANCHGPENLVIYTHPGRLRQNGEPLRLA